MNHPSLCTHTNRMVSFVSLHSISTLVGLRFGPTHRHTQTQTQTKRISTGFDWLARLSKRGEKFDMVILDPPSSSVGKKKKRWSVKSDMAELVALAAPLVKKGGLLWTTTNNAGLHPIKFATMCKKGLENAGLPGAKLERVVPMPVDFPSVGISPVKNLVWRIP